LSSEFFFYRISQIQQQMKAVGNLSRLWCAAPGSAGIQSEPVARDDLHFRMCFSHSANWSAERCGNRSATVLRSKSTRIVP
jgi:hypothetical protein